MSWNVIFYEGHSTENEQGKQNQSDDHHFRKVEQLVKEQFQGFERINDGADYRALRYLLSILCVENKSAMSVKGALAAPRGLFRPEALGLTAC